MHDHLNLYTDGAARNNPGPAGIAAIIVDDDGREVLAVKEYIGEATNNVAEYRALILGLTEAQALTSSVSVKCDSELVVRQVKGEYKVKNVPLKECLAKVMQLKARFKSFDIESIPRSENTRADEIANEAIDEFQGGERAAAPEVSEDQGRLF